MNAQKRETSERERTHLLDVSPVLETGSPTPLSTHWIPLHELLAHWTDGETVLLPAPVAPLLTAIGYALFALSRETRALRLYTLATEQQQWHALQADTNRRCQQAIRSLDEAAHHWSRAAFFLDCLRPTDLDPPAFERAGDFRASRAPNRNAYGRSPRRCAPRWRHGARSSRTRRGVQHD